MNRCPEKIDGARVVRWIELDSQRHRITDAIRLYRDGQEQTEFFGLAIATYDDTAGDRQDHYLFYCDPDWETLNDSLYDSLDEATTEAERQFSVERDEWIDVPLTKHEAEQGDAGKPNPAAS
ncbi:MAG: hypothetical protein KDM64_09935 [Verrucomicrobiae bacterium]|nr:hypothetical protein [Verrucomicrobiae bacterium]MCB1232999.1 hypothetical protein [Verrucomicrobiae bacterium]